MSFATIYPLYVAKVERKGHSHTELDELIHWLTGYDAAGLDAVISEQRSLAQFFEQAPSYNPNAELITGVICGCRVETITDPLMRQIRQLDKIVDELAKGKALTKIMRTA
jgi:hypothetical protein